MTDRDYQHSRLLDVHCWSEHTEANKFVDYVYDTYLNNQSNDNKRIKKRHLKVVLSDLYVAWLNNLDLNIAVNMTIGAYSDGTVFNKGKSKYNELNIKVSTIEIGFWICSNHSSKATQQMGIKEDWKDIGNILGSD